MTRFYSNRYTSFANLCLLPPIFLALTKSLYPKIITRYVIRELAKIFLISSFGFVVLMILVGLIEEATKKGLGPDVIFQLVPYIIPKALMFAMPATCLFSVTCVFGRMAADNELIAVQSMGLSKSVLVWPAIGLSVVLSLGAVWLNDISFAWSYRGIERVVLESSDKIVYGVLKNEGSFQTDRFSIDVQAVDGHRLIEPRITINTGEDNIVTIAAREAILHGIPERHSLSLIMRNGSLDIPGKASYVFTGTEEQEFQLKSPEEVARASGNPSHLYLSQIPGEIETQSAELQQLEVNNGVRATGQLFGGDFLALTHSDWTGRSKELTDARQRLRRLYVVPFRRWANGFSCLAFAIIGIPVAMRLKNANYATTFGICFLPILLIYYPLFIFGLDGAKYGSLPPYAAWLGNAACIAIGLVLLVRELRS